MAPKRRFKGGSLISNELFDNEPTEKAIKEIDEMTDEEFEDELGDIGLDPDILETPKTSK